MFSYLLVRLSVCLLATLGRTPEQIYMKLSEELRHGTTVYPKKYAHGFCVAVLCCGYTLTDFHISIRLTSLALWQSNDCPSASKATLMNMDKYFMSIHYERLHNHNKAKHHKTVCIFIGMYCRNLLKHIRADGCHAWLNCSILLGTAEFRALGVLLVICTVYDNHDLICR